MSTAILQRFYQREDVPLSSGSDRARRQARMLTASLRETGGQALIIDIGCGDGAATAVAVRANPGHHVVALDWSPDALKQARGQGLTVMRSSVEPPGLAVADGVADVVIMSELIEHLVDIDSALDEARRVLKPGGTLLLSTPNLAAWYNRGLLALGVQPVFSEVSLRGIYGRPGSQVAGHLRIFTRRALMGLLTATGFGDIAVTGACYHDVPRPLRFLDRAMTAWPDAASILLIRARKPGIQGHQDSAERPAAAPAGEAHSPVLRIYHPCINSYRCRQLASNIACGSTSPAPEDG